MKNLDKGVLIIYSSPRDAILDALFFSFITDFLYAPLKVIVPDSAEKLQGWKIYWRYFTKAVEDEVPIMVWFEEKISVEKLISMGTVWTIAPGFVRKENEQTELSIYTKYLEDIGFKIVDRITEISLLFYLLGY